MSNTRDPLFHFSELTNSDTVLTWLTRTNQIIRGMNTLYVADTFQGNGICITRTDGIATINVNPGPAIAFTADNKLTVSMVDLPEIQIGRAHV